MWPSGQSKATTKLGQEKFSGFCIHLLNPFDKVLVSYHTKLFCKWGDTFKIFFINTINFGNFCLFFHQLASYSLFLLTNLRSVNLEHNLWSPWFSKLTTLSIFFTQDSEFCSFFGRIEETIICFRDLLTFSYAAWSFIQSPI